MNNTVQLINSSQRAVRGFTLIELMVAMVLSLFLIGGVILMYTSSKAAYIDSNQLSRMQENVRFASDYMVRDIRNAGFRDQLTLVFAEQQAIQSKIAEVIDSDDDDIGDELVIRYAGRGHCGERFQDFRVVENRYFLDAGSGELRCSGRAYDPDADSWNAAPPEALVGGLTDLAFSVVMADGSVESGDKLCQELVPVISPGNRCLAIEIGLELEALRDLNNAGEFEERFVELTSTLRNSAIKQIYAPCSRLEEQAGVTEGTWCS